MDLDQQTIGQGEHVVQFYEREETLALAVAGFLGSGLVDGDAAIVVATPEHRAAFEAVLMAAGVDLEGARTSGRYVALDARAALSTFMVDGMPDREKYLASIGGVVAGSAALGPVRIYGEMVAVLWDEGNVVAALALEELWNDLTETQSFALFCAYPKHAMLDSGESVVCHLHSAVIPEPGPLPTWTDQAIRRFEPASFAAVAARRFVREVLASWGEEAVDETAELIVSELATNAVQHTARRFVVSLVREDGSVLLAVRDQSAAGLQRREQTLESINGRGLHIVGRLAERWGTEHHEDGKTVWAQLASR